MSPSDPLRYEMHVPTSAPDGATVLVLLHGRGSHRRDLLSLAEGLPEKFVLVTPEAPHPGRAWGYGPGWAWYRYLGENRVDGESLETSLDALDRFLAGLPDLLPMRPGHLVVGGFSQGGTTSIAWALRHPGSAAGILNFSGFLADGLLAGAEVSDPTRLTLFWGHGTDDPNIPHGMAVEGRRALEKAGARVTARDYPIGHWITPDEMADAVAWVQGLG